MNSQTETTEQQSYRWQTETTTQQHTRWHNLASSRGLNCTIGTMRILDEVNPGASRVWLERLGVLEVSNFQHIKLDNCECRDCVDSRAKGESK